LPFGPIGALVVVSLWIALAASSWSRSDAARTSSIVTG
jgi:hypothetical protein